MGDALRNSPQAQTTAAIISLGVVGDADPLGAWESTGRMGLAAVDSVIHFDLGGMSPNRDILVRHEGSLDEVSAAGTIDGDKQYEGQLAVATEVGTLGLANRARILEMAGDAASEYARIARFGGRRGHVINPWNEFQKLSKGIYGSVLDARDAYIGQPTIPTVPLAPITHYLDNVGFRRTHILNRHRSGMGRAGKSEWPSHWSDERILHNISEIAADPNSVVGVGRWNARSVVGIRDGIKIQIDYYPPNHPLHAGSISTAYPISVRKNPR